MSIRLGKGERDDLVFGLTVDAMGDLEGLSRYSKIFRTPAKRKAHKLFMRAKKDLDLAYSLFVYGKPRKNRRKR